MNIYINIMLITVVMTLIFKFIHYLMYDELLNHYPYRYLDILKYIIGLVSLKGILYNVKYFNYTKFIIVIIIVIARYKILIEEEHFKTEYKIFLIAISV